MVSKVFTPVETGVNLKRVKSQAPAESETLTFDVALVQLQQVVKQLEGGELSLEDSLKAFERGVALSRVCQGQLAAADQKIEVLLKGTEPGSTPELAPFDEGPKKKA